MTKAESNYRGVYERDRGSGVWWIRWHDSHGCRHREKVGSKSAAINLVEKRRVQVREGNKLPELRRRVVTFGELAADALEFSKTHKRSYGDDKGRMPRFVAWWKDRAADSLTPEEIEGKLASVEVWADATRNRARALLSLTYKLAIRHGKAKENPARLVQPRPERNVRRASLMGGNIRSSPRPAPRFGFAPCSLSDILTAGAPTN